MLEHMQTLVDALQRFEFVYPFVMAGVWVAGAVFFWWFEERRCGELAGRLPTPCPRAAVIVPCHNEAPQIRETIRALSELRYPAYEIIAIDDGSTDATGAILEALAADEPRLRVLRLRSESGQGRGPACRGPADGRGVRDLHRRGRASRRGCRHLDGAGVGVEPRGRRRDREPPDPHAVDRTRTAADRRVLDPGGAHQAGSDGHGPPLHRLGRGLRLPAARARRGGVLAHGHAYRGRPHHLAPAARRLARAVRAPSPLLDPQPGDSARSLAAAPSLGHGRRPGVFRAACRSFSDGGRAGCG